MAFNTASMMVSAIGKAKNAAQDARLFARENQAQPYELERTPSPWVAQEIANVLGYGVRMDIDNEMTINDEMDVDTDDSTDMEVDSDPPTSIFSSSASSGVSSYTPAGSPPTTLSFGPAPVIIDLDEVMIDVQDTPEEHTDNKIEASAEVPADWLKPTHNPGLFTTPTPCKVWQPTNPPIGPHPLSSSATLTSDPPTIPAEPSREKVKAEPVNYYARAREEDFIEAQRQAEKTPLPGSKPKGKKPKGKKVNAVPVDYYARAADEDFIETQRQAERTALPDSEPSGEEVGATPVDYYARAADEDFIEAQRQGENTALPESDDEELGDGTGDVLRLAANIPLPASEEVAENIEDEKEGVMDQEVGEPAGIGRDEAAQEEETTQEQSHAGTIQVSAEPQAVPQHDSAESENFSQNDPTIVTRPQVAIDVDMTPQIENNPPTSHHENLMEITIHSEIPAQQPEPEPEPEPESAQIEGMDITPEEDMVQNQQVPLENFSELPFPNVLPEMEPEPTQMEGMDITQDQGIPQDVGPSDYAPVESTQDTAMDDGNGEDEEYDGPWEDVFDINAPGPRGEKRKRDGCSLRDVHPDDQHAEKCYIWDEPEDSEDEAGEEQDGEEQDGEDQAGEKQSIEEKGGEESIEDSFRYDVEYGQALMDHFIRHRLPEVAVRVMFPEARYNDNVRADEAQRFASWLDGLGLREAGRDLIEQAFEDQEEMSAEELIDLFWDWYEEQIGATLDTYEVSLVEEDITTLDEDLEEALWDYIEEHPPEEDA
ncbi:hypothetical protein VPNG_03067 [Cytospora leucostoma]|uniref:Uncharacterized protein n=1 Tax=Cytospora leucostoma TaxID=1230097 RepID=A0A423XGD1_9PEZI|nr:hypothetical protein VPNG_03067 [Cytospora leucostoma]